MRGSGIPSSGLLEHPAVIAWSELRPERIEPRAILALRIKKKSAVYRLEGVGNGGAAVIAKWSPGMGLLIERTVYQEVLPLLPASSPLLYGYVQDLDGSSSWLFLEDAGGEAYSPGHPEHRGLAARWLAELHTVGARLHGRVALPERWPDYYLDCFVSARQWIGQCLTNPRLDSESAAILNRTLAQIDALEGHWDRLEALCGETPRTIVHGDLAVKNLRVRNACGGAFLLAFDWEMAGWEPPAVDLAQFTLRSASPDLAAYASAVQRTWPSLHLDSVHRLANVGRILRFIAAMSWESLSLLYESPEGAIRNLGDYALDLAEALRAVGLER